MLLNQAILKTGYFETKRTERGVNILFFKEKKKVNSEFANYYSSGRNIMEMAFLRNVFWNPWFLSNEGKLSGKATVFKFKGK